MGREYCRGEREEQRSYARAVQVKGGTTVYLAGIGAPAKSIDDVGATFDLCQDRGVPIV